MSVVTKSSIPTLAARLGKVHVLLVDDDTAILHLLRGLLQQVGFTRISTATNGSQAIEMLKDKGPNKGIDLIITDWNMEPVNGLELIKFVRTSNESPNPYMPIIMLSGRGEWTDVEKARDTGFSEYLIKPFSAKSLCDRILLCVENPRAFVSTANYKGPSRRRKSDKLPPGVTQDRRQRTVENNLPGKALKSKIGFDINMRQIFTKENLESAQEFIDNSADDFVEMAMRDIGNLHHALRNAQMSADPTPHIRKIRNLAFSVKSHAGTFGYDLGTQVAKSLQAICDNPSHDIKLELLIIEKHIDTLRLIFQKGIKGRGGEIGMELMTSLNELIRRYKQKQSQLSTDGNQRNTAS